MLGLTPDLHRAIGGALLSRLGTEVSEQAPILSFLVTSAPEDTLPDVLSRLASSLPLNGRGSSEAGTTAGPRRSAGCCLSQADDSPDCEVARAMLQALQWRAELPTAVRKRLSALDGGMVSGGMEAGVPSVGYEMPPSRAVAMAQAPPAPLCTCWAVELRVHARHPPIPPPRRSIDALAHAGRLVGGAALCAGSATSAVGGGGAAQVHGAAGGGGVVEGGGPGAQGKQLLAGAGRSDGVG